jgi:chemotaxis protein CheY-P-specific phosphatase CheC
MPDIKDLTSRVVARVMGQLAFMFGERVSADELPPTPKSAFHAEMSFSGPFGGIFGIVVPAAICPSIAANVLGIDEDDPDALRKGQDALKELVNVACGHILTEIAGEDPVFDLTVPDVSTILADDWDTFVDDPMTVILLVDEEVPVLARLSIRTRQST